MIERHPEHSFVDLPCDHPAHNLYEILKCSAPRGAVDNPYFHQTYLDGLEGFAVIMYAVDQGYVKPRMGGTFELLERGWEKLLEIERSVCHAESVKPVSRRVTRFHKDL